MNKHVTWLFLYFPDNVVPLCVDMCLVAEEGLWRYLDFDILGDNMRTMSTSNVLPLEGGGCWSLLFR